MARLINIGTFVDDGKPFKADLDIVLRSNVLVQANSGGGKSWALRRMIEQTFGKVPQIVIDPEGEFSTLRQRFDFVLVGKGGDTPADVRSAALLAHRLLELGASAIVDLFEMSKLMRPLWVATFVQALVDAPKKLWRDLLVYIDEAHELAPESGHGIHESRDEKTCRHALIDLAAKGRKRGYGVIAATQRLGKLSKDFAAELKNVLIGQTFIDLDRERAAGSLGISKIAKAEFFNSVKTLEPGSFFSLGRAYTLESTLVLTGDVETEHPEAGRRQSAPPPPTAKIKHLLPQLADLPKEAEQKLQTEKELRGRIVELERQVRSAAVEDPKTVEKSVLRAADQQRLIKSIDRLYGIEHQFLHGLKEATDKLSQRQQVVVSELGNLATLVKRANLPTDRPRGVQKEPSIRGGAVQISRGAVTNPPSRSAECSPISPIPTVTQRMLAALRQGEAMQLSSMPFKNVAVIAGVSPTSGTTSNRRSFLATNGFITVNGKNVSLTDKGRAYPIDVEMPPTDREGLLQYWKREIGTEKIAIMLETVVRNGPVSSDELRAAAGMENSGTFSNYRSALVGRGLIMKQGDGTYVASEVFG